MSLMVMDAVFSVFAICIQAAITNVVKICQLVVSPEAEDSDERPCFVTPVTVLAA